MIRRLAIAALISLTAVTAAACTAADDDTTPTSTATSSAVTSPTSASPSPSPTPDDPDAVLDLTGDWKQTNSAAPDSWQAATIADGQITVLWVTDGGDTTTLYWAGSFDAPTKKGATYSWQSENDHSQTDGAADAAKDDTLEFSYADGVLSYEVTADGDTSTVELGRVN